MTNKNQLLTEDDLDNITEEELDELETIVDEYIEICTEFEADINDILERVNGSSVYDKLGKELHIDVEYVYSFGDREE